jgi:hypothetical protein
MPNVMHTSLFFLIPIFSPIPLITMHQPPQCSSGIIHSDLRLWVNPVPRSPGSALPPSHTNPQKLSNTSHTHIMNVELRLHNTTTATHQAKVLKAAWSQSSQRQEFRWSKQPDLSPLNRYNTIEHLALALSGKAPIEVELELTLDGKSCTLKASTNVPQQEP